MDFFESQELARKKTRWLVFLFTMAVMAITIALLAVAVMAVGATKQTLDAEQLWAIATDWQLVVGVVVTVVSLIGLGSATKMLELRQGGSAVASLLGGRRIVGNARTLTDRKVANIVEEMALASGTPVPPVYILDDEESINAFAAGYTVDDAVIGINRGTAEKLSREELQGVIAHEFSHILNGDMRMSLRMVAILNGILLISIIGGQILNFLNRSAMHRSHRRSDSDDKGSGGFIVVMYLVALGLYIIGSIGLFFGRWIKSSVSQQREFLADASAVQFTRQPDGIGGALKVIGGFSKNSAMQTIKAEEISHMFFGSCRSSFMFPTHPPLLKRIRVIDEKFDGDYQKFLDARERRYLRVKQQREAQQEKKEREKGDKKSKFMDFFPGGDPLEAIGSKPFPINPMLLIAGIGIPTEEDVEFSGFMVGEIEPSLLYALRETWSARCVVFASLLGNEKTVAEKQLKILLENEAKGSAETTLKVKALYDKMPKHLRLGAFEIIQGTLSAMSPDQYPAFRQSVNQLIVADNRVDLFEFFLFHHLIVHLDRCFHTAPARQNRFNRLEQLKPEIAEVISILSRVGTEDPNQQKTVFVDSMATLFSNIDSSNLFVADWDHRKLSEALTKLSLATPPIKKEILSAAVVAISHDKVLTVEEVELFRAMSESMDCPVPPLVATRREAPELPGPEDIGDVG